MHIFKSYSHRRNNPKVYQLLIPQVTEEHRKTTKALWVSLPLVKVIYFFSDFKEVKMTPKEEFQGQDNFKPKKNRKSHLTFAKKYFYGIFLSSAY